ncbi:MAG TPA: hypothetical protein VK619_03985 [Pyrinomonadaceae bacterium]|nr:hypothetical protein [Pyrinomonadaceae bacterium]
MAKNESRRIRPATLQADRDGFDALKGITNYTPANQAYTVAKIETSRQEMEAKQAAETQAKAAYDAARDEAVAAEWAYHNIMLGASVQIDAQFGKNSNEYQSLGKKKPTEYKTPQRKVKAVK